MTTFFFKKKSVTLDWKFIHLLYAESIHDLYVKCDLKSTWFNLRSCNSSMAGAHNNTHKQLLYEQFGKRQYELGISSNAILGLLHF